MNSRNIFKMTTFTFGTASIAFSGSAFNTVQAVYNKIDFFDSFLGPVRNFSDSEYNGYFKENVEMGIKLYKEIMGIALVPDANKSELPLFVLLMKTVYSGSADCYVNFYKHARDNKIDFPHNEEELEAFKSDIKNKVCKWLETNASENLKKVFFDFFKKVELYEKQLDAEIKKDMSPVVDLFNFYGI